MIRTKGEPGTGDIIQAVRHLRLIQKEIRDVASLREDELYVLQKEMGVSIDLIKYVHKHKKITLL